MKRFVALFDLHWGYERRGGHKIPLHDLKALLPTLAFIEDFRPHHIILGGDMLDCGPVSHHHRHKPGEVEGLRLLGDAQELHKTVIAPLESMKGVETLTYHVGNHEDWLTDLTDEMPSLEGIVEVGALLKLDKWKVIEQGAASKLGKLTFIHGDQISGGEHMAKNAVTAYEKSVRFGHFHTYQAFTKNTPLDQAGHTGVAVPCLCKKDLSYQEGKPNKWMQGFNWGYIHEGGIYTDYVTVIVNGRFVANGKEYRG